MPDSSLSKTKSLLIEIGTEELPPKALEALSIAFEEQIREGLKEAQLDIGASQRFATPRRLAVLINDVSTWQPDRQIERRGPSLKAAFDQNGNPSKAAQGFARSCGVNVEQLQTLETEKGSWLIYSSTQSGVSSDSLIPGIVETALGALPIPKRMRWANRNDEFVRPVHWIVLLFGNRIINSSLLGISSGNQTYGHRFHHPEPITLNSADSYSEQLKAAKVITDFAERRDNIRNQINELAEQNNGNARIDEELLNEVTALVEWPVALLGNFEERFLQVPAEALITTMQDNQKYFPLVDQSDSLLAHFITISNIESKEPDKVRAGNERVIRPRFSDAEFFWQQDLKTPLQTHQNALKAMVFQQKLGTLFDKSERVAQLAQYIASQSNYNTDWARRAAQLSKCDLLTKMVQEFPELQGTMGHYYALNDGEPGAVACALEQQYQPRFAGDKIPETDIGRVLALAERLDTLIGIFSIGQAPSGTKDPFALRRAALGVIRIVIESQWELDLLELLQQTSKAFNPEINAQQSVEPVFEFILERMRGYYLEQDYLADVFEAVLERRPSRPLDFERRLKAVTEFRERPEAESLAAANKRIRNILKSSSINNPSDIQPALFKESAEETLFQNLNNLSATTLPLFEEGRYADALSHLASLKEPVDQFFDEVMVMVEDSDIKRNRMALLTQLSNLFLRIADFSRLQH